MLVTLVALKVERSEPVLIPTGQMPVIPASSDTDARKELRFVNSPIWENDGENEKINFSFLWERCTS